MNLPRATYRIQLRDEFGFADAAAVVPYLADLGISHVYLSPPFEATAGSTHGYDVVDPNRVRASLGGRAAFDDLGATARAHGMGIVIDIVPHHMAAAAANEWWWSVLELGQASPFARHFDIDWDPPERRLRGSVLLPVLGDHYGRVLEAGELTLGRGNGDQLVARYYDNVAPLSPETADELWAAAGRRGGAIEEVLAEVNADIDRLDGILDRQHHRFARWQVANHELDYRRFFDVDSLVALRSEREQVFADTHRLALALVQDGLVDGLRVDHVDGLRDPQQYTDSVRSAAPETWIVLENILRPDERMPTSWPVDGTTGYEFLASAGAVLVDPDGLEVLTKSYAAFTGDDRTYHDTKIAARREVLRDVLDADLERLVAILVRVCEHRRRWRDFTRAELREALAEVVVHAPAYRAYLRPGDAPTDADRAFVQRAIDDAAAAHPDLDAELLALLRSLMLGAHRGDAEDEFLLRCQQLTGPVAAKGEEDTAFYRWIPLLAANEVGSEPDHAFLTVAEFHERQQAQQAEWPRTMLTTSTHDTKRSEDVRARLTVLTELPSDWDAAVHRWSQMNERHRDATIDAPDRHTEWFVYQTLVGAHPLPADRAWTAVEKSLREAKLRTSWVRQDEGYETATRRFVEAILGDDSFVADLAAFVDPLVTPGYVNSLALVTLRLLCPGVPDTYQGCELWDWSLVDPDNRRPVDYEARRRTLAALDGRTPADAWRDDRDGGAPKLALIKTLLALRARRPDAFGAAGTYEPLRTEGIGGECLIAFARAGTVVAAVPRLALGGDGEEATVALPPGAWTNVLTGSRVSGGDQVPFAALRAGFPVAVFERTSRQSSETAPGA